MGSAVVQVFGNVVAPPKISLEHEGRERVCLRVVATERKRDADSGAWSDGEEFGVNVVCWRALAKGVSESIFRGDPVVVIGKIFTRNYQVENENRSITEIRASYVGHDLSKGTARFQRFPRLDQVAGQAVARPELGVDALGVVVSDDPALIHDEHLSPEPGDHGQELASAPW